MALYFLKNKVDKSIYDSIIIGNRKSLFSLTIFDTLDQSQYLIHKQHRSFFLLLHYISTFLKTKQNNIIYLFSCL